MSRYQQLFLILKNTVETTETKSGLVFAVFVQSLIVFSLFTFSIGTLPNLASETLALLDKIEVYVVIMFTIEYFVRMAVADKPLKFVFSFFGLVDLLAILPFYLASGFDLRGIRVFRLLRLIKILKLLRYSQAISRFHRAVLIAKEELILFGVISLMLLFVSAIGIYYFENDAQPEQFSSIFNSLWWAVTTLTTVGYGDMFPITTGGRIFTFFILIIGLGIIAIPTGLLASALNESRKYTNKMNTINQSEEPVRTSPVITHVITTYENGVITDTRTLDEQQFIATPESLAEKLKTADMFTFDELAEISRSTSTSIARFINKQVDV